MLTASTHRNTRPSYLPSLTSFPAPSELFHDTTRSWSRPSYSVHPLRLDNPPGTSSYWFNWSADIPTHVNR